MHIYIYLYLYVYINMYFYVSQQLKKSSPEVWVSTWKVLEEGKGKGKCFNYSLLSNFKKSWRDGLVLQNSS